MYTDTAITTWALEALDELRQLVSDAQEAAGDPDGIGCLPTVRALIDDGEELFYPNRLIAETNTYRVIKADGTTSKQSLVVAGQESSLALARIAAHQEYAKKERAPDWEADIEVFIGRHSLGIYHVAHIDGPEFLIVPHTTDTSP